MAEVRAESVVSAQAAPDDPEPLPVAAAGDPLVVAVGTPPVGAVGAAPTLMINHNRESLSTCMINPAGFLTTKLPRYVPATLGATRSTDISAFSPGFVTGKGTEAGALMAFSE